MIRPACWLLPLSIAACAPIPVTEAPVNMAAGKGMAALDSEGVRFIDPVSGSARLLSFGVGAEQARTSLTAAFGAPTERHRMEECGAGPIIRMAWSNGFEALFQDEIFLGWNLTEPGLTTIDGIGVGSRRFQIEQSRQIQVERTTLGTEFHTGGISGLLSSGGADAEVTHVWAGLTCHFR